MTPEVFVNIFNNVVLFLFAIMAYAFFLLCWRIWKIHRQLKTAETRMVEVLANKAAAIRIKNGNSAGIHKNSDI